MEQSANDCQKFQNLVKLQICFEVSLVYLTILEAAPTATVTNCDGALESVLRHRNHRCIIIIIIIIKAVEMILRITTNESGVYNVARRHLPSVTTTRFPGRRRRR